jgi:hypothetical protein
MGGLAFIPFLAALVPVIWRAGQEPLAVAVAISGGVFVSMAFVSNAAETALIDVADSNQPAAVLAETDRRHRLPGLVEVSRSARPWVVSRMRPRIASRVTKLSDRVTSPIGRARSSPWNWNW